MQILFCSNVVCELLPKLGQYGLYKFTAQNGTCGFKILKEPTYPYTGTLSIDICR